MAKLILQKNAKSSNGDKTSTKWLIELELGPREAEWSDQNSWIKKKFNDFIEITLFETNWDGGLYMF